MKGQGPPYDKLPAASALTEGETVEYTHPRTGETIAATVLSVRTDGPGTVINTKYSNG